MTCARVIASALLLAPALLGAQGLGTIAGTVVDSAGTPVGGVHVRVLVEPGSLAMLTGSDGRFTLAQVPVGAHELEARKSGYRTTSLTVTVSQDSTVFVNVRLRAESQVLPGVVIAANPGNVLTGIVTDANGKPITGATAEVLDLRMRIETGEDGRFAFYDLTDGVHLLQWRKDGYKVAHRSVTMAPALQRDFAISLRRIGRDRYTAARAADVSLEMARRRTHAGTQSLVVARDEFERLGRVRIINAIRETSARRVHGDVRGCLLVNGFEPTEMSWLTHYRANEVELMEFYPEGSDNSRSICGRFPPRFKGCTCNNGSGGMVLWLRTN